MILDAAPAARSVAADAEAAQQNAADVFPASLGDCPVCGGPVKPPRVRRGKPKIYCGRRCAKRAWERSHPRMRRPAPVVVPPTAPAAPKRRRQAVGRRVQAVLEDPLAITALELLVSRHGSLKVALQVAVLRTAFRARAVAHLSPRNE